MSQSAPIRASLFVTCIIDQLYPEVGVSVVRVLRRHGIEVDFPEAQTCCGQPLYNSGFTRDAKKLAARTLDALEASDYVVVPSGSCGAMMRVFYEDLFADDPDMLERAQSLGSRVYEFTEFLTDIVGVSDAEAARSDAVDGTTVAYHPSCHLLREMRVKDGPRRLLQNAPGIELADLPDAEQCCGFGGAFSVKYPHISEGMLQDKISNVLETGADTLVACDMSCLMHIGGGLSRQGHPVATRHIAEILDSREGDAAHG